MQRNGEERTLEKHLRAELKALTTGDSGAEGREPRGRVAVRREAHLVGHDVPAVEIRPSAELQAPRKELGRRSTVAIERRRIAAGDERVEAHEKPHARADSARGLERKLHRP